MRTARVWIAFLTIAVAGVGFAPSARAATPSETLVATVPLSFDCSAVPHTPLAKAMVRQHGLCGDTTRGQAISPNNTVYGSCGSLSLYVFNSGQGYLQWKAEITSSLGPFVTATYQGTWANTWLYQGGNVVRTYWGLTSGWLDIFPIQTGYGQVVGRINFAKDLLFWGGSCTNTSVVDSRHSRHLVLT